MASQLMPKKHIYRHVAGPYENATISKPVKHEKFSESLVPRTPLPLCQAQVGLWCSKRGCEWRTGPSDEDATSVMTLYCVQIYFPCHTISPPLKGKKGGPAHGAISKKKKKRKKQVEILLVRTPNA